MLKKLFTISLFGLWAFSQAQSLQEVSNYEYKFKINGLKDAECYLGYHFGDKQYVKDTLKVNSKGEVTIKGKDTLQGGMYMLITPEKKWLDFVVSEPSFSIEFDANDPTGTVKVKNSVENQVWFDYLKFISTKEGEIAPLRTRKEGLEKGSKEMEEVTSKIEKYGEEIQTYRNNIMKQYPGTFTTSILNLMKDVEIPKGLDTASQYWYYRAHYFDHINLNDGRLIRTPVFEQKFKRYKDVILPQTPDTLAIEIDKVLSKTTNPEVFKFIVHNTTVDAEKSKVVCMDKLFYHMIVTYYAKNKCNWVNNETLEKMIDKADKMKNVLCGNKAVDLILPDTNMVWHSLYKNQPNDYTVLYFWDATCGHCKKMTPVLKEMYERFLKPNNIGVYAVEGELKDDNWKAYLKEHKLPWTNVSTNEDINNNAAEHIKNTTVASLNYRLTYNISSFPVVYVLDKDKNIIAKEIGVEQLEDFLTRYMKIKK